MRWNTAKQSFETPTGEGGIDSAFRVSFSKDPRAKEVIGLCAKAALLPATLPPTPKTVPNTVDRRRKQTMFPSLSLSLRFLLATFNRVRESSLRFIAPLSSFFFL